MTPHTQNKVTQLFNDLKEKYYDADLMVDGMLDEVAYRKSKIKILWILKQDFYDSGALEETYTVRIQNAIEKGGVDGSPTWRKMSQVSHALLSGERNFDNIENSNIRAASLLETAIIEVNKELGDSDSPDKIMQEGFAKYKELIFLQIDSYKPDLIIICLPETLKNIVYSIYSHCHGSSFDDRLSNVRERGSDIGVSKTDNPIFLWAHHPQATKGAGEEGISDEDYTKSIVQAYENVIEHSTKK